MNMKKIVNLFTIIQILGWYDLLKKIIGIIRDVRLNLSSSASAFAALHALANQSLLATAIAVVINIVLIVVSAFIGIKIERALPSVPVEPRSKKFRVKDFALALTKCCIAVNGAFTFLTLGFTHCNTFFVAAASVFSIMISPLPLSFVITLKIAYLQTYLSVMFGIGYVGYLLYLRPIVMAKGYDDLVDYTYNSIYYTAARQYFITFLFMVYVYVVPLFKPIARKAPVR